MFENLLNRRTFDTEKELILYVIENCDKSYSKIYKKYAKREWKSNPKYHTARSPEYTYDSWIMEWFSNNSDDLEIIEALWKKYKYGNTCWTRPIFEIPFVKNVNLTDDLIRSVYSYYSPMNTRIWEMQKVEYKNISKETKELIDNHCMTQRLWRDAEDLKQLYLNWNRNQRYAAYLKEKVIPFAEHVFATGSELDREWAREMAKSIQYERKEVMEGRLNAPEDWEE